MNERYSIDNGADVPDMFGGYRCWMTMLYDDNPQRRHCEKEWNEDSRVLQIRSLPVVIHVTLNPYDLLALH